MTGWEITQALKAVLRENDTTIEAGLVWLAPDESARLYGLLRRLDRLHQIAEAGRVHKRLPDIGRPHPANREDEHGD